MKTSTSSKKQKWLNYARKIGATHLIIVRESPSGRLYPEYIVKGEDLFERLDKISSRETALVDEYIEIKQREAPNLRLVVNNGRLIEHAHESKSKKETFKF